MNKVITYPVIVTANETNDFGSFSIGVFTPGYAQTIGVSLRRILLSSIPGAGIVYVKITGVLHKLTALDCIKEDVIHFIENLKLIRFRFKYENSTNGEARFNAAQFLKDNPQEGSTMTLDSTMLELDPDLEIVNKVELCTININSLKKFPFEFSFMVEKGTGYVDGTMQIDNMPYGAIPINNSFNGVERVCIKVQQDRYGEHADYEKLELDIYTDGTIKPKKALMDAISILVEQYNSISNNSVGDKFVQFEDKTKGAKSKIYSKLIKDTNLKEVICITLENNGILTIGDLLNRSYEDLMKIPRLGHKKIEQIEEILNDFNLLLKRDK